LIEVIRTKIQGSSATNYQFTKWQWNFFLLRQLVLSSITDKNSIGLYHISNTTGVL